MFLTSLSLKDDVYVPSKKPEKLRKTIVFCWHFEGLKTKIAGSRTGSIPSEARICRSGSVPQCHGFATLFLGSKLVQVPVQVEDSENFLQDLLGRSVRHDVEHNLKYKTRETVTLKIGFSYETNLRESISKFF